MVMHPSDAWKVVLAIVLGAAIVGSVYVRAPHRAIPGSNLRRLVLSALGLYAIGAVASLTHHPVLAALVYASGITICALAAWLSRGSDSGEPPPDGDEHADDEPPGPDGFPEFDWDAFERDLLAYSERERTPAGRRYG
jgi:hypothetical protein